jgi:hypothetical protein
VEQRVLSVVVEQVVVREYLKSHLHLLSSHYLMV